MRKAISSLANILVVLSLCLASVPAQTAGEHEADAIKQDVSRLYSTTMKKVSVKLRNGTKLKGYIGGMDADTFVLRSDGKRMDIRYSDVSSVSRTGLSGSQKTAFLIGAAAAVVVVAIVFRSKRDEGGWRQPCFLC